MCRIIGFCSSSICVIRFASRTRHAIGDELHAVVQHVLDLKCVAPDFVDLIAREAHTLKLGIVHNELVPNPPRSLAPGQDDLNSLSH
jgi:hypothetical protein